MPQTQTKERWSIHRHKIGPSTATIQASLSLQQQGEFTFGLKALALATLLMKNIVFEPEENVA